MDNEEKIFRAYDWAYQRVHHYDRVITERTNYFFLFSSILLTGFILLVSQLGETVTVLCIIVAVLGIFLSLQYMFSSIRGIRDLRYWVGVCITMEDEESSFHTLKERDLVYIGFLKWRDGIKNRYTREDKKTQLYKATHLTTLERKFIFRIPLFHEWNAYRYIFPFCFTAIWITALIFIL